jgi:hypothetical protein
MCRNAYTDWGDGKEAHGTAFMVGRIADVVPSTETEGRWLVTFDQYARIDIPDVWQGWRNPVKYTTLDKLGVSLQGVTFQPMPPIDADGEISLEPHNGDKQAFRLTISEAKRGLAASFGVPPDAVEITIRG